MNLDYFSVEISLNVLPNPGFSISLNGGYNHLSEQCFSLGMWDGKLFKGTKLLSARIGFELQPCHLGAD
jgi:hypothetical protein